MRDALLAEADSFLPWKLVLRDVEMNRSDWLEQIGDADAVLWPPGCMGVRPTSHLKEKVFYLEQVEKRLVVPNYSTVWHFESKAAQSLLFKHAGVEVPRTVVTFSLSDAKQLLRRERYPVVFKSSADAASRGVRKVKSRAHALWLAHRRLGFSQLRRLGRRVLHLDHPDNALYWQEFVPENDGDLRVTVIGDRYAVAFRRRNRPGDFRASGSGRLVYDGEIPEAALHAAIALNRRYNFDSMAYDFLMFGEKLVFVEMSYGYVDRAVFNAPGYFERGEDERLTFHEGHVWPQQLWVRWLAERMKARRSVE